MFHIHLFDDVAVAFVNKLSSSSCRTAKVPNSNIQRIFRAMAVLVLFFVHCLFGVCQTAFLIAGLVLLGFGLYFYFNVDHLFVGYLSDELQLSLDAESNFPVPPIVNYCIYALILLGCVTFVLGLLGCCALFESVELVAITGLVLIVVLILEAGAGIYVYSIRESLRSGTKEALRKTIATDYKGINSSDATSSVSHFWDVVMARLECCGVDSYRDFNSSTRWIHSQANWTIPIACCVLKDKTNIEAGGVLDPTCPLVPTQTNSNKEIGCFNFIWRSIASLIENFFTILIVLCAAELVALLFSCCICAPLTSDGWGDGGGRRQQQLQGMYSPCHICTSTIVGCAVAVPRIPVCRRDCRGPMVSMRTMCSGGRRGGGSGCDGTGIGCAHIYCHHDFQP